LLESIEQRDFNIFAYTDSVGRDLAMKSIYKYIIKYSKLIDLIDTNNLENFLGKVFEGYLRNVPYHNELHGIDVCQTLFVWIENGNIDYSFHLSLNDLLALYTAGMVHDFKHPGFNNTFLTNGLDQLALIYNDKSVLENFHTYEAFKVILGNDTNIFKGIAPESFRLIRKRMIECILATDMTTHGKIVSIIKMKLTNLEIKNGNNIDKIINLESKTLFDDQQEMLNFLIHCADLSHNTKNFSISKQWTDLLFEEYYHQGDVENEKGLPVSFLCDRKTTFIEKSQAQFNKAIILPTFEIVIDIFPNLVYLKENVEININEWNKLAESKEKCYK